MSGAHQGHIGDLGVPPVPVLDLQPLAQMTDDARIEESFSGRVEPGLVAECAHQDIESLTEGVVAEVVEARTPSGGREQVGWHGHRAVPSSGRGEMVTARCR